MRQQGQLPLLHLVSRADFTLGRELTPTAGLTGSPVSCLQPAPRVRPVTTAQEDRNNVSQPFVFLYETLSPK